MSDNPPGWHPDPTGRHENRYWDGEKWTDNVADQGNMSQDPVEKAPEAAAPIGPSMVNLPAITPELLAAGGLSTPSASDPPPATEPPPAAQAPPPAAEPPAAAAAPAVAAAAPAGQPTSLALLLTIAAPGSGHLYLGVRREIAYGLIGATVAWIILSWFISFWVGLIVYVVALGFALFDLRPTLQPLMGHGMAALSDVGAALAWRLVTIGGIALVIGEFLPWYRVSATVKVLGQSQSFSDSGNAFDAFGGLEFLWLAVGIAAIALGLIHVTQGTELRAQIPAVATLVLAIAAALAWVLVIYRLLSAPGIGDTGGLPAQVDVDTGRAIGALLDYAAAVTILYGALAAMQSKRAGT